MAQSSSPLASPPGLNLTESILLQLTIFPTVTAQHLTSTQFTPI